jgi:hypothetical protein
MGVVDELIEDRVRDEDWARAFIALRSITVWISKRVIGRPVS